jgi:ABC-type transporter Mla subunit MlaD
LLRHDEYDREKPAVTALTIGNPAKINPVIGRNIPPEVNSMAENSPSSPHGWLQAAPDLLDQFARDLDALASTLADIRSTQTDLAAFLSPSTDPATVRAAARLAEDAQDREGTAVHVITQTIDDLHKQAYAASTAARAYRAAEQAGVASLEAIREKLT